MHLPRFRSVLTVVLFSAVLAWAEPSSAQIVGWFTVHGGQVAGGDTVDSGAAWGVSAAAFELNGWLGADVDLSHAGDFNKGLFEDSGLTTLMVNAIARMPRGRLQPYLLGGVGGIRVRGCTVDCVRTVSKTEFGLGAGAGVQYFFSEHVGARGELRYFRILDQLQELPRTNSGSFDFFRWTVGVTLRWAED